VQDESIKGWMSRSGKKIQRSAIGRIIRDLQNKPNTEVVDRFFASTQLCRGCGKKNKIPLSQRTYSCECGYELNRDHHASLSILEEGLKQLGMDHTEVNACGDETSTLMLDRFNSIPYIKASFV
jgi:putative transposase